jgi:hypothetical protein
MDEIWVDLFYFLSNNTYVFSIGRFPVIGISIEFCEFLERVCKRSDILLESFVRRVEEVYCKDISRNMEFLRRRRGSNSDICTVVEEGTRTYRSSTKPASNIVSLTTSDSGSASEGGPGRAVTVFEY